MQEEIVSSIMLEEAINVFMEEASFRSKSLQEWSDFFKLNLKSSNLTVSFSEKYYELSLNLSILTSFKIKTKKKIDNEFSIFKKLLIEKYESLSKRVPSSENVELLFRSEHSEYYDKLETIESFISFFSQIDRYYNYLSFSISKM